MRKLFKSLKKFLRKWLGIEALEYEHDHLKKQFENVVRIDSDVGMKGDTMIIITSTLANGRVEVIHVQFDDLRSFEDFIRRLQNNFGVRRRNINFDLPLAVDRQQFRLEGEW
jgi:hypothetical protein